MGRPFLLACAALLMAATPAHAARRYDVDYLVRFRPAQEAARVTVAVAPGTGRPTRMDFAMDPARYVVRSADGALERDGETLTWHVPHEGGRLEYDYRIGTQRENGAYDSRITDEWVVLRGDDLVPPARVRATIGSRSRSRLRFELPEGWRHVATPYEKRDGEWIVSDPGRRFDRPVGWMIAGDVGIQREQVDGMEVVVAAPREDAAAREDVVAMLDRALPEARAAFPVLPRKLLIVRAGDPMWRGGLSAPRSFWLHADRPVVDHDGTSPVLHELTHATTRLRAEPGADWIVEGVAEYYSLELRRRSGALGAARHARIVAGLERRARHVTSLHTSRSSGARTASAVLLLQRLDGEIRERSGGRHDIDDLVSELVAIGKVSTGDVERIAAELIGAPARTLETPLLARRAHGAADGAVAP